MPNSISSPDVLAAFKKLSSPRNLDVTVDRNIRTINTPFPSPADWRDQWIYFLLVDRFNNPSSPPRSSPFDGLNGTFQGGTFNGVRAQLGYLQHLGVGAIWLSPVLKNCQFNPFSYHGYGIQDFMRIDPRFASSPNLAEAELQALVDEAHARGIYVILDIVLNHAGDVFAYVLDDGTLSSEAAGRDQTYEINWRDQDGHPRQDWTEAPDDPPLDAAVWPVELRKNAFFRRKGVGGEAGGDFASLKEMVTAADPPRFPVRDILIRAHQYLIARFDIDGFRIDTLKFIEPDFAQVFGNAMREFALSIGKKNFFTFGEVYDSEEKIARFIGRQTSQDGDIVGVDAALDFPLFFKLPAVAKGQSAPSEVVNMFEHRKDVERTIVSSHGEAGRFFVTFLDNHDQTQRFFFSDPRDPQKFQDQLTLGVSVLFALQGIPCLYYGTEQGLHGLGNQDLAVREALWGKPNAFDPHHPFYESISRLATVRGEQPALRYGRQYFRPISGNGAQFGISTFGAGVIAFSRLLNDQEVVIVANTNTTDRWEGEVIVDRTLNPVRLQYEILFSNKRAGVQTPGAVIDKPEGIEIREPNNVVTRGPARAIRVKLQPMEIQILRGRSSSEFS